MSLDPAIGRLRRVAMRMLAWMRGRIFPSGLATVGALMVLARIAVAASSGATPSPAWGKAFYGLVASSLLLRGVEGWVGRRGSKRGAPDVTGPGRFRAGGSSPPPGGPRG